MSVNRTWSAGTPLLRAIVTAAVLAGMATPSAAQETIPLWPDGPPHSNELAGPEEGERCVGNVTEPTLTIHHPDPSVAIGAAVLVISGGGYGVVCLQPEGWPSAEWLTRAGITAAVLKYRLPNGHHEVPIEDAQQALRLMRSRAEEWGVAPNRIGVMGFSAGGHLASTVGTHYAEDFSGGEGDNLAQRNRPDFMILVYPVITLAEDYAHGGSRRGLLGEDPAPAEIARFSNHLRVTPDTPPTFLVHASDDEAVHPFNSIAFYQALKENSVPAELHVFDQGGHGFGLSDASPARGWYELAQAWLYRLLEVEQ